MNVPGSLKESRSTIRVCSECFALTQSRRDCCPACGANVRRREAWERVVAVLVVGTFVGALISQQVP